MRVVTRIPGIHKVTAKGHVYYYHRASGVRIRSPYGTPAFLAEIEALAPRHPAAASQSSSAPPGTLGYLVTAYRGSPEFAALSARTQADYQAVFDYLKPLSTDTLSAWDSSTIIKIRDAAFKKRKRRFANYTVSVLSLLFNWGLPRKLCETNPARDTPKLRRPRDLPKANRRWTKDELDAVLAAAPRELQVPILFAACTGMREGDVLSFPWSGYDGARVKTQASKTGATLFLPVHPLLRAALDHAPRVCPVVVVGARGKPFTPDGFRARFFRLIKMLESGNKVAPGLTFHGLRTTCATMLAEAGCTTQEIMAITGHKTEAMVAHYTREASRDRQAKTAIEKLEL